MPRTPTQKDWIERSLRVPLGFIAAVLLSGNRIFPPMGFPDFVRFATGERINYTSQLDKQYIQDAIEQGLFNEDLIRQAREIGLYDGPEPKDNRPSQ